MESLFSIQPYKSLFLINTQLSLPNQNKGSVFRFETQQTASQISLPSSITLFKDLKWHTTDLHRISSGADGSWMHYQIPLDFQDKCNTWGIIFCPKIKLTVSISLEWQYLAWGIVSTPQRDNFKVRVCEHCTSCNMKECSYSTPISN